MPKEGEREEGGRGEEEEEEIAVVVGLIDPLVFKSQATKEFEKLNCPPIDSSEL